MPIPLIIALQNGGGSGDLTFLAYLDTWIIGGLVLLAVVVVTAKWLWGRFHRDDDPYEYTHDDDYPDNLC